MEINARILIEGASAGIINGGRDGMTPLMSAAGPMRIPSRCCRRKELSLIVKTTLEVRRCSNAAEQENARII